MEKQLDKKKETQLIGLWIVIYQNWNIFVWLFR